VCATEDDRAALAPVRAAHPRVRFVEAPRGRARQMNAGAAHASSSWLIFLHADTELDRDWPSAIDEADRDRSAAIGCFRFALASPSPFARVIEAGVRWRVAFCALPYGDQALFVRRSVFEALGGYADVPLMEDVDLVRRARRVGSLYRSRLPAITSARRWEQQGWIVRTARNLWLIALYALGVPPAILERLDLDRPGGHL